MSSAPTGSDQGAPSPLIELASVSMEFGRLRALEDVDFHVRSGEVVGLLGDNGAGKSTLVKIITGYHEPTRGEVRFMGRRVRFKSPAQARSLGIETVYQDLALIEELSLWRNFFLGKELYAKIGPVAFSLRHEEMRRHCEAELKRIGITRIRSAEQRVALLSGGERQSLAITRAVYFGAKVLLLDEPTAALSVRETDRVFQSIRHAREQGLGVLYIDHNVEHVYRVADRIVMIEHGRIAGSYVPGEVAIEDLIALLARSEHHEPPWLSATAHGQP
jgi:simple sugar transport system ATP-binding protein